MTPHNEAVKGDYAETVLLPGDPDRAEWVAKEFLDDVRCVNRVRGAWGFTGKSNGVPVSVQATGMGHSSLGIYAHELIHTYGARRLIRIGTCGGLAPEIAIRELAVSTLALHDAALDGDGHEPDAGLLRAGEISIAVSKVRTHFGRTASSDVFYHPEGVKRFEPMLARGCIAVDMETAGLYRLAQTAGIGAISICTVVDHVFKGEMTPLSERQAIFGDMARLALAIVSAEQTT